MNGYLRGQDVKRWFPEWNELWMIFTRRGVDIDRYPAVKNHLSSQRHLLEPKPSNWDGDHWPGRKAGNYKWYEIQDPVEYWEVFEGKKLVIQRIAFHSRIGYDDRKMYVNDAAIIIPTSDLWLLACLDSSLLWWFEFRSFPHKKDEGPIPKSGRSWYLWQPEKAGFSEKSDCIALYSGCESYHDLLDTACLF